VIAACYAAPTLHWKAAFERGACWACRKKKKGGDREDNIKSHISKIVDGVMRGKMMKDPYGMDEEQEGPESYKDVVQTKWNFLGTLIFLYYCAASILYFIYRAKYTLDMGILWCADCHHPPALCILLSRMLHPRAPAGAQDASAAVPLALQQHQSS
jgi:hypothetical protein